MNLLDGHAGPSPLNQLEGHVEWPTIAWGLVMVSTLSSPLTCGRILLQSHLLTSPEDGGGLRRGGSGIGRPCRIGKYPLVENYHVDCEKIH